MTAREGAHQEQIADVGAGDEQDEGDDGEHDFQSGQKGAGVVEGRLPQRPESNGPAAISGGILGLEAAGDCGEFLLSLGEGYAGLEACVGFDPARAAIFKLVAAGLEDVLHGSGHPEVHAPTDEGAVKAFGGDADDGVHYAVEALRLADDLRITAEAPLPELVADYGDGMRALPLVFAGKEAATKHGGNADGVEVVGGDDAAGGALGTIADAERGAG